MLNILRMTRVGWLAVAALALATAGPLAPRVINAQGPPNLEAMHQRLLPVFELAGVVFTDADETRGRVIVGVLDRGVEGLVRATAARLGLAAQNVEIIETDPIFQVATLRDYSRPVVAGVQIRFSAYVCSVGFNAIRNGVLGFVTASHCSDRQGTVDGTQVLSARKSSAGRVHRDRDRGSTIPSQYQRLSAGAGLSVFRLELR